MFDTLQAIALPQLIGLFVIAYFASIVKGAIGFAMPLIVLSTASLFVDPRLVIAGLILPILVSNLAQMLRLGPQAALLAIREFGLFIAVLMVMIYITTQFIQYVDRNVMLLILGVATSLLSAIQLSGWRPVIPENRIKPAAALFGFLAGAMGGLAGTWGPVTVLYMLSMNVPKAKQVIAQGAIFTLGGIPFFFGHLQTGLLNKQTLPISVLMIIPVYLGMRTGFLVQDRIDQATFRRVTLIVLMLAGANLVRYGLGY